MSVVLDAPCSMNDVLAGNAPLRPVVGDANLVPAADPDQGMGTQFTASPHGGMCCHAAQSLFIVQT